MGASDEDPSNQLLGSSITYRIAVGPQRGRKVLHGNQYRCIGPDVIRDVKVLLSRLFTELISLVALLDEAYQLIQKYLFLLLSFRVNGFATNQGGLNYKVLVSDHKVGSLTGCDISL